MVSMEDIVSLCKRRGFIFQGSEIYGGLSGTYDYGPLGVQLKRNLIDLWWKMFVEEREDMYGLDAAILMNQKTWVASGHVDTFNDPLIEDIETKQRYRLDHLLEDNGVDSEGMTLEQMANTVKEKDIKSPSGNKLGNAAQFNLMFKTQIGPVDDESSTSYLRPETAQGIFVNFKNVVDTFYPDLPFGIGQVGKAFRNEISPRDFIFRLREMEQMEVEYFVQPSVWEDAFEDWRNTINNFYEVLGLPKSKIVEHEIGDEDRAHYSKRTIDFEYEFPFGRKELMGLAYRTDYDLSKHQEYSGKNLEYRRKDGGEAFVPHVIEPSMGVERLVLAVLHSAYTEDEVNGEKRVYLKLPANIAPVKVAVSPLLKNKPELVEKAREVYKMLKKEIGNVMWDDNGNIGKRYRRQDEIGTPYCVVIDFDTLEGEKEGTVTVRNRDTTEQKRVNIAELAEFTDQN
ncbi:glycine--tRNA ligase [Candidatus Saccharibacteria bacterium]|nr:glycine--tRNA ligase [Candidatus Saccharibacteria bacterium]